MVTNTNTKTNTKTKTKRKYDKWKSWGGSGICKECGKEVPFLCFASHAQHVHGIFKP